MCVCTERRGGRVIMIVTVVIISLLYIYIFYLNGQDVERPLETAVSRSPRQKILYYIILFLHAKIWSHHPNPTLHSRSSTAACHVCAGTIRSNGCSFLPPSPPSGLCPSVSAFQPPRRLVRSVEERHTAVISGTSENIRQD
jgi:hypothetical protein